jgi:amidase
MDDIAALDATAQADLVRSGQVTPLELVDGAIDRAEAVNGELNAIVTPLYERARELAAGVLPDGPFTGVPMVLKDLLAEWEGTRFTEGSALAGEFVSGHTQELTNRFLGAGFVPIAKANTPEFGILPTTEPHRFGPTRNPWAPDRTTGGSSGGSAAAVAAGVVPVGHANDGGGSIRIPASCCGLFGLKPSRGRVSPGPEFGDVNGGIVAEHVVTRSVRDSAAILDVTHGLLAGDPYSAPGPAGPFLADVGADPGRLRIAVLTESLTGVPVEADCSQAARETATWCEALGHEIVDDRPDIDGDAFVGDFITSWAAGVAATVGGWEARLGRSATPDDVETLTWAMVEAGQAASAADFLIARQGLQRVSREIGRFMTEVDVWLMPTLAEVPVPLGTFESPPDEPLAGLFRAANFVPFTPVFNVTGQPAASIPLHESPEGIPVGTMLVGRYGDEATILRLSAQLEAAHPWADRRPGVWSGA